MSERSHDDERGKERGNKPIDVLRDGSLRLAIFRNQHESGESYAMVPGRIYTDKETGKVHETHSLNSHEALRMAHLLTRGHDRVSEFREQDKAQEKEQSQERPREERAAGRERSHRRER